MSKNMSLKMMLANCETDINELRDDLEKIMKTINYLAYQIDIIKNLTENEDFYND